MARRRRRDLKKEAFWRRVLRGPADTGLSIRAWCRKQGVRESAFYWWRTRRAPRAEAPTFVPIHVSTESSTGTPAGRIEIVLAGDRRVHVVGPVDRQALADVLAVLEVPAEQACAAEARGC